MARGFSSLSKERMREVATLGGHASQASGRGHRWSAAEAAAAGRKGGATIAADREHMARIGKVGGRRRQELLHKANPEAQQADVSRRAEVDAGAGLCSDMPAGHDPPPPQPQADPEERVKAALCCLKLLTAPRAIPCAVVLALVLALGACGVEPAPYPGPRPVSARADMATPSLPDGGVCEPCKPDQPDTCLGHLGRCVPIQGAFCCLLPWPYSCKWHPCSQSDPGSCQGGTCEQVSGGSCCVYGARAAASEEAAMAARIKRAADRDDARSVERCCGKNLRADRRWLPRRLPAAPSSPDVGGDPPPAWLGRGAYR